MQPPREQEIEQLRAAGELQQRLEFARGIGNHKLDKVLLQRAVNRAKRSMLRNQGMTDAEINNILPAPPPARRGLPTVGDVRILAILIDFADEPHSNSRDDIHDALFGNGNASTALPYESLTNYYARSSYNRLNLTGETLGWYRATQNRANIGTTSQAREALIQEALDHFDSAGHAFQQYDNNGDGVIEYLIVLWSGPDTGWSNFWWAYNTRFNGSSYQVDNVTLDNYSWLWEARPVGQPFRPTVIIHETGHALGLADYYDYDNGIGPRGGVGGLDMMDSNVGDHNCFSKWLLDWIDPSIVARSRYNLNLGSSGATGDAVLMWPYVTEQELYTEYFMVQNRHREENDSVLGADGFLIWHIDAHLDPTLQNFNYDNSFTSRKLLRLMEADGLEQIESGQIYDSGDFYSQGDEFGPHTTPSSNRYDGSYSGVSVRDISAPGNLMSATFEIELMEVCAGSSNDLDRYRSLYNYSLPPGKTPDDIVDMGVDGSNNYVFAFFKDGTVCAGSSNDLDSYRSLYNYSLPPGKTPDDIVGIGIDGDNNHVFAFFRDGTVCAGSSNDLDGYRSLYNYSLPPDKTPDDIVGMSIDGSNNYVFAFFRDGTVCAGSSNDLDRYRSLYNYSLPPGKTPDDIVGMGVDGDNDFHFVFFRGF